MPADLGTGLVTKRRISDKSNAAVPTGSDVALIEEILGAATSGNGDCITGMSPELDPGAAVDVVAAVSAALFRGVDCFASEDL